MAEITDLKLVNFRSYRQQDIRFSGKTTVVLADNGKGKTNLLEAIYVLSRGSGFRAEKDRELILAGADFAKVFCRAEILNGETLELEARFLPNGENSRKQFLVAGAGKRLADFAGRLPVVLFWPQDIEIITGSPSLRRRYLDDVLAVTSPEYRQALKTYEHGLKQRNRLLEFIREKKRSEDELDYWDKLIAVNGALLQNERREFVRHLNKTQHERQLDYEVFYQENSMSVQRLSDFRKRDIFTASTNIGPHRDDFVILAPLSGEPKTSLHVFGSRAQQRLGIFWLKMGEIDFIEEKTDELPLLLLDDILSELDHHNRNLILPLIKRHQTIITAADRHLINLQNDDYTLLQIQTPLKVS